MDPYLGAGTRPSLSKKASLSTLRIGETSQLFNDSPPPSYDSHSLSPHPHHDLRKAKSSTTLRPVGVESPSSEPGPASTQSSFLKNALDEAQFFAGGILSRATESSRHFTVIRHSFALIWYRGPGTSVTISVLSDSPLPLTRTVWLQRKGFSGKTGMALKAMVGSNDGWINITPSTRASPSQLKASDERGIQRDLVRFADKASGSQRKHVPRETYVLRIPASSTDGYFRVVICEGENTKKTLCGSPVFRIASTSTDSSVIRGAGIRTLPIEIGVKVGTVVATNAVMRYAAPAAMVAKTALGKSGKKLSIVKKSAAAAYHATGLDSSVARHNQQYASIRSASFNRVAVGEGGIFNEDEIPIIGPDAGPEEPFPIKLQGTVVKGTGMTGSKFGMPTANLSGVGEDIKTRLRGVYVAWASVQPSKGLESVSHDWHESVVFIGPTDDQVNTVVKNKVRVHFMHDFGNDQFLDAKVKVILMAFIRDPLPLNTPENDIMDARYRDLIATMSTLSRETWCVDDARQTLRRLASERSFSERVFDARDKVQRQVDRVPVHLVGVRSESDILRENLFEAGGLWVPR